MKYTDNTTKTAKTAYIRQKLETETSWLLRGLLRIYAHQTAEEQACGDTRMDNGVGFTGVDGEILSSFAQQVQNGRTLSDKQMNLLGKKMPKYAKQLMNIAENGRETV